MPALKLPADSSVIFCISSSVLRVITSLVTVEDSVRKALATQVYHSPWEVETGLLQFSSQ